MGYTFMWFVSFYPYRSGLPNTSEAVLTIISKLVLCNYQKNDNATAANQIQIMFISMA